MGGKGSGRPKDDFRQILRKAQSKINDISVEALYLKFMIPERYSKDFLRMYYELLSLESSLSYYLKTRKKKAMIKTNNRKSRNPQHKPRTITNKMNSKTNERADS